MAKVLKTTRSTVSAKPSKKTKTHAKKAICVFSGGVDSTTLLYYLLHQGWEVKAITFDYGQKHRIEIAYAKKICQKLGIEHKVIDLRAINQLLKGSALSDSAVAVPKGSYAHSNMKTTVVPNRNMIFLSVAAGWAVAEQAKYLAIGAHGGDRAIYPDCRPNFIKLFGDTVRSGNYHKIKIYAPFLHKTKKDIVKLGKKLGIDYTKTWSCYNGGKVPCGKCSTCIERKEALEAADS